MRAYDSNILLDRWNKRIESLPQSIRTELEDYAAKRGMTDELLFIKQARPRLEVGDVFVVQPKKDLYFYGRVLKTQVDVHFHNSSNFKWKNSLIVCVYRNKTTQLSLDGFKPSYDDLLVFPSYVVNNAFFSGYLYKIGHVPLTNAERVLDYGFFSTTFRIITDAYGAAIDTMPKLLGISAIGNFGAIAFDMRNEFIIDPSLLGTKDIPKHADIPGITLKDDQEEEEISEDELIAIRTHTLNINARLMPLDRGDIYEDQMDEVLNELGIGCVVGSGTSISKDKEPLSCDIEIELVDNSAETLEKLKEYLKSCTFPKGSTLYLSETEKLSLGTLEGLALYLNGTGLSEEIYKTYSADDVVKQARELLGKTGRNLSYWNGSTETALYFYGESFKKMKQTLSPLLKKHPLCQKCRVVQVA